MKGRRRAKVLQPIENSKEDDVQQDQYTAYRIVNRCLFASYLSCVFSGILTSKKAHSNSFLSTLGEWIIFIIDPSHILSHCCVLKCLQAVEQNQQKIIFSILYVPRISIPLRPAACPAEAESEYEIKFIPSYLSIIPRNLLHFLSFPRAIRISSHLSHPVVRLCLPTKTH